MNIITTVVTKLVRLLTCTSGAEISLSINSKDSFINDADSINCDPFV